MISITGTHEQFTRFFQLATINGTIRNLMIEVDKKLFASEQDGPTWVMVTSQVFVTEGKGFFVVKMDDIESILKVMAARPSEEFTWQILGEGTDLSISSPSGVRMKIDLPSIEDHTDEGSGSSYVAPNSKGKRFCLPLAQKQGAVIPTRADNNKAWDQVLAIDRDQLRSCIRTSLDKSEILLETRENSNILSITTQSETILLETPVHLDESAQINWAGSFNPDIKNILTLSCDAMQFSMTDEIMIDPDVTWGIWIILTQPNCAAYYWMTPAIPLEE